MSAQPGLKTPPAAVAAVLALAATVLVLLLDLVIPVWTLGWGGTFLFFGLAFLILLWRARRGRQAALRRARKGNEGGG